MKRRLLEKSFIIFFAIGLAAIVGYGVAYAQSWFDPGWNYRSSVIISNPGVYSSKMNTCIICQNRNKNF